VSGVAREGMAVNASDASRSFRSPAKGDGLYEDTPRPAALSSNDK
jgi:hypothetical protein